MSFDLDFLIDDYLTSVNGRPPVRWSDARETWERDLLHVTDLNACPRAVGLRLRGAVEEQRAPQESRKFVLANFQHELIYLALDWGGYLVDKEVPVPLPDGWVGTADMVLECFYDDYSTSVNVADSKNPVAGAKKYADRYPKVEDIRQVSVYSAFLPEVYPELEAQVEGQVFYLPLGGASEWVPARFPLVGKESIIRLMEGLELVRDAIPDPLALGIVWWKRQEYVRKDGSKTISGDLYYSTDWRCRYCRYACPNRSLAEGTFLCHVGKDGLSKVSPDGRKMLDEIHDFLLKDAGGEL